MLGNYCAGRCHFSRLGDLGATFCPNHYSTIVILEKTVPVTFCRPFCDFSEPVPKMPVATTCTRCLQLVTSGVRAWGYAFEDTTNKSTERISSIPIHVDSHAIPDLFAIVWYKNPRQPSNINAWFAQNPPREDPHSLVVHRARCDRSGALSKNRLANGCAELVVRRILVGGAKP